MFEKSDPVIHAEKLVILRSCLLCYISVICRITYCIKTGIRHIILYNMMHMSVSLA